MRRIPLFMLCVCTVLIGLGVAAVPTLQANGDVMGLGLPGDAAALAADRGVPLAGEGTFPYVIVTGRGLRDEFLALARERARQGVASRVRSLESLRPAYPAAADDAERVRLFLRDAHAHWGTRWVLLGGDTDVVPARHASVRSLLGDRSFVSDWYYACLDGTWDGDGDGRYGELPSADGAGDEPDLVPELVVGRAPVSNHHEARDFVRKTLAFERRADPDLERSTLLFANRLLPGLDLAAFAERLLPRIADDPDQRVARLYESWDLPAWTPGALPETRASVIAAFDAGHHVAIGFGAGAPDRLEVGTNAGPDPQLLTVADVLALANGDRAGHLWLMTSLVNAFDHPTSLAEAFLRARDGGAVTVIAPSDLTFAGLSDELTRRFVEQAFDVGAATIGEALVEARAGLLGSGLGAMHAMTYQLLGDPMLRVFSSSPVAAAAPGADHGRTGVLGRVPGDPAPDGTDTGALLARAPAPAAGPAAPGGRRAAIVFTAPAPSPAVAAARIEFTVPPGAVESVDAGIVDLAGRTVRTLAVERGANGGHGVTWDLRDRAGRRVPAGIYFLRVSAGSATGARRVAVAPAP